MSQPEVLTAIMNRRAIRHYTDARVSADQVKTLLDAAVHAPTAMHMEPWAFVIVQEPSVLKRLSDTAKKLMLAQPLGDDHRLLHHRDVSSQKLRTMLSDQTFNIFYDAKTLIVVCGKPSGELRYRRLLACRPKSDAGSLCLGARNLSDRLCGTCFE